MTEQIDYDPNTVLEALNNKADRDLNNVTDGTYQVLTTKNITNCITKIPQDIKYELVDGVLTFKQGTKVYFADGSSKTLSGDNTVYYGVAYDDLMFFIEKNGNTIYSARSIYVSSGTTEPAVNNTRRVWYDTTNKIIKMYAPNKSNYTEVCFPLAMGKSSGVNDTFSSIDQVFNGFGYIGSTIFALPGVEGLIPNGRNTDGSLNNKSFKTTSVLTANALFNANLASIVVNSTFLTMVTDNNVRYDNNNNFNFLVNNNDEYFAAFVGTVSIKDLKITSFNPKTTFQILDRNDKEEIISWGIPDYSAALSGRDFNSEGNPITAPRFFYIQSATNMIFKVNDVQYTVPFWVYVSPDDVRTASATAGGASYQCIECPLKGVI